MPPRFAYWTIILDDAPTSFRTKEREEILPLFNQLKAKNPSALLKWFSGGKLWDSPEQAREVRELEKVRAFREERARERKEQQGSAGPSEPQPPRKRGEGREARGEDLGPQPPRKRGERREARGEDLGPKPPRRREAGGERREDPLAEFRRQHGRPADGSDDPTTRPQATAPPRFPGASRPGERREAKGEARPPARDRRGKDWRPGGDHRDPRDKYKLPPGEARKRWKERNLGPRGPKPPGPFRNGGRGFSLDGPPKPTGDRPWSAKPRGPKPFGEKPFGKKPFGPPSTRDGAERSFRPGKPFGSKPGGPRRPFTGRPPGGPKRKG